MNGLKYLSKKAREEYTRGFHLFKKYDNCGYDVASYGTQEIVSDPEIKDYLLANLFLRHVENNVPRFLENEEEILGTYANIVGAFDPYTEEPRTVTMDQLGVDKKNTTLVDAGEGFIRAANLYEGFTVVCVPQKNEKGQVEAFGVERFPFEMFNERIFENKLSKSKQQ